MIDKLQGKYEILETSLNDKVLPADHDSLAARVRQLEHEAEVATVKVTKP